MWRLLPLPTGFADLSDDLVVRVLSLLDCTQLRICAGEKRNAAMGSMCWSADWRRACTLVAAVRSPPSCPQARATAISAAAAAPNPGPCLS